MKLMFIALLIGSFALGDELDEKKINFNRLEITCEKGNFSCNTTYSPNDILCIPESNRCDGIIHCVDNSDEENCPLKCRHYEWHCQDKKRCIHIEKYCDGKKDCNDDSDEPLNCKAKRLCNEFRCKNDKCLNFTLTCNGIDDCGDNSDELDCDKFPIKPKNCTVANNKYLCNNRNCINLLKTCDYRNDCGDFSDEDNNACDKSRLDCNACEHGCYKTPRGPVCFCHPGYVLHDDHKTCKDVDECAHLKGACSQNCVNTASSYYCTCDFGYKLDKDEKTCKHDFGGVLIWIILCLGLFLILLFLILSVFFNYFSPGSRGIFRLNRNT